MASTRQPASISARHLPLRAAVKRAKRGNGSATHACAAVKRGASLTRTERMCRVALLAALALALSVLESLIPLPMPVPGMRLGIANVATLVAAYALGPVDAAAVLIVRIVLAAVLTGQLSTLPFSLAGGCCALVVILLFAHFAGNNRIRLCSMAAGIAHNAGQMAVAVVLTATPALIVYLPVLLVVGTFAGFFTGSVAAALVARLDTVTSRSS